MELIIKSKDSALELSLGELIKEYASVFLVEDLEMYSKQMMSMAQLFKIKITTAEHKSWDKILAWWTFLSLRV